MLEPSMSYLGTYAVCCMLELGPKLFNLGAPAIKSRDPGFSILEPEVIIS
jgi:hypothetical protein